MTDLPAARACGVSQTYGQVRALDNITLDIPAGCMAGLIGPDGVGKSTFLALLAGVRRIQHGEVQVLGIDVRARRERRALCPRIAYVPQGLGGNLYATLSVRENLEFFSRLFDQAPAERDARIAELLAATGLTPFAERTVSKLSGGMKQKLGLCCALIHDPEFLILDEPTTGIDPLARRQFWDLIRRIRDRSASMSVLVATAYMEEAEGFDWLAMLNGGRILATGTPEELRAATGDGTLEDAYIQLLPEAKRRDHRLLTIPPLSERDSGTAIETRDLTRRFGSFTAVDRVSFSIERGEIFGFIGSNGCGKTTTMKVLTGLLPASEGTALLFGQAVEPHDLETRRRVGYMSQSFSLYGELSVLQNLELHAHLFDLPVASIPTRVDALVERFDLDPYADVVSAELPLGIRQRLSLAVALVHEPEVLILDEPTSGVDPVARDAFWELLFELSRSQGKTIFISTHFMNEASRCDRIALMHAGRVLSCATPSELVQAEHASDLEDAFVSVLGREPSLAIEVAAPEPATEHIARLGPSLPARFRLGRLLAYAHREFLELRRDPVRIGFALLGPLLLLAVFGFGISLDIENIPYAVLDHDQSPQSRRYLENFEGSRHFERTRPLGAIAELERGLRNDEIRFGVEIPPNFGRDLKRGRKPEVAVWLSGAVPFRTETIRGYVRGVHERYLADLGELDVVRQPPSPFQIETRFLYNQEFRSTHAIVPGVIAILMMLIPAILTAVGVVREKELGSITNFYATPVTRLEFLLGKQLPYVCVAMVSFVGLVVLALTLFRIPLKGSSSALFVAAAVYAFATTGFGLLVSSFVRSQIAALLATTILTMTPAINFSGLLVPVSSLTGASAVMSRLFPIAEFLQTSVGAFTKGLSASELYRNGLGLMAFVIIYWIVSAALMRDQER